MNKHLYRASLLSLALSSALGASLAHAAERSWAYTYTALGLIETADGPRTDVADITRYAYDAQGHLTSVTNALGHVTTLSNFDTLGHPQTVVDANGVSSSLTYTPQGWLKSISIDGSTTSFEHSAVGDITKVTRGDGSYLTYTWDDARRLRVITNRVGQTIEYDYDLMGNRTAQRIKGVSANLLKQTTWVYDELGRLQKNIGYGGQVTQQAYDLNDNPTQSTDPLLRNSTQAYDALNRLTANTDPLNGITEYQYDAQDNLTQVKDPRAVTTTYTYDGLGNLTKLVSPDTGTTTYVSDAAGNVTQKTDAAGTVTNYTYDALNRLKTRTYPANTTLNVTYSYDMTAGISPTSPNYGIGRLTALRDSGGLLGYYYDKRGNLVQQARSVTVNGQPKDEVINYAYNNANQLIGIGYPTGFAVNYPRNIVGDVASVTLTTGTQQAPITSNIATAINYAPFGGPLRLLTWGNGINLTRTYDLDYQLKQQDVGSWQSKYSFDLAGNIKTYNHNLFGNLIYGYDDLDRLTEEKAVSTRKTYSYDANSNRKQRISYTSTDGVESLQATQTLSTATDSNRLLKIDNTNVAFHPIGSIVSQAATRSYTYNRQGRLNQVKNAGKLWADYSYNALGQRTLKRVYNLSDTAVPPTPIATYSYLYGADGQLLGQTTYGSTGLKTRAQYWIWLDGMPLAGFEQAFTGTGAVAGTKQYYLHSDHLNTPRQATDASQKLLWSWSSDAFGVGTPNADVDADGIALDMPLRFPGQQYDAYSGLNYNYFRDYDPNTGRYVESDPIGLNGGLNTYGYVGGNPLSVVDPYGLKEYSDDFSGPLPPDGYHTSEMTITKCGRIPPGPLDAYVSNNMSEARSQYNPLWFYNKVRNKGPWDYKQQNAKYQDFGNFNYGASGTAFGFPRATLFSEAGKAQQAAGTSKPEWGSPGSRVNPWSGTGSYGDDPDDQAQINNGAQYCECSKTY